MIFRDLGLSEIWGSTYRQKTLPWSSPAYIHIFLFLYVHARKACVPLQTKSNLSIWVNRSSWLQVKVVQLCPTLCDPMDYTVPRILQAKILEWVAIPFSQGSSQTQGWNPGLLHCRQILCQLSHQGSSRILDGVAYAFSRGSSRPRNRTGVSCIAGDSLPAELPGKPLVASLTENDCDCFSSKVHGFQP